MPFEVLIRNVPDTDLGPLLSELDRLGFAPPAVTLRSLAAGRPEVREEAFGGFDLPEGWEVERELAGAAYEWPQYRDRYDRYTVYRAQTAAEGLVHIGLGEIVRENSFGRRRYIVAFESSGAPANPLVEWLETDDHAQTGEVVSMIRGRDGGRAFFGPGDALPDVYAQRFETVQFNARIQQPRAYRKMAVVTREDDVDALLDHALIRARTRRRRP